MCYTEGGVGPTLSSMCVHTLGGQTLRGVCAHSGGGGPEGRVHTQNVGQTLRGVYTHNGGDPEEHVLHRMWGRP